MLNNLNFILEYEKILIFKGEIDEKNAYKTDNCMYHVLSTCWLY